MTRQVVLCPTYRGFQGHLSPKLTLAGAAWATGYGHKRSPERLRATRLPVYNHKPYTGDSGACFAEEDNNMFHDFLDVKCTGLF